MDNSIKAFCHDTLSSIRQSLYICNNSLEGLNQSSLSVAEMKHYKTIRLELHYMNRICNMADYILSTEDYNPDKNLKNYDIDNLLELMLTTLKSTVSEYFPVKFDFHTNLQGPKSVLIDQRKFESIVLNVLHCCLSNNLVDKSSPAKITIYVTETKDSVVFHIRDNIAPINSTITDSVFSNNTSVIAYPSEMSYRAVAPLTLAMAKKSAEDLRGKLTYSALKSGNRFDLYLPKYRKSTVHVMRAPVPYIPSRDLFWEVFADIRLEHTLQQLIDALESEAEL